LNLRAYPFEGGHWGVDIFLILIRLDWLLGFSISVKELTLWLPLLSVNSRWKSLLLKEFFIHLSLYDHERCVYEGSLEQLALEHPYQVFDARILKRLLHHQLLLLLRVTYQCELPICCLIFRVLGVRGNCFEAILDDFSALSKGILGILAINALVVKFLGRRFEFMEYLQHILISYLS